MRELHNRKPDLNLLAVFDAIMTEGNLTRAGGRLGMTQSAVSHALARLREMTSDPLFERTRRGVRPTPRAIEMSESVHRALDLIRASLSSPRVFDPATARQTFLLDLPAGVDAIIVPRLVEKLKEAPGIDLRISSGRASSIRNELRYGETYLALDFQKVERDGYRAEQVYSDPFVVIARAGHPALQRGLTRDAYQDLGHVAVFWSREATSSPVTDNLTRQQIRRPIRLTVPTLATMLDVVETSDLLGSTWRGVAESFARTMDITVYETPFDMAPVPIYMVWHETFDSDSGHAWLRSVIIEICAEL